MPEGTKVDRVYKALRREGKSEESAAKIAQSQTGEALATGKPLKEKVENIDFKDYRSWKTQAEQQGYKVVEHLTSRDGSPGQLSVAKDKDGNRKGEFNFGFNDKTTGGFLNTNTHFQNGRNRATQEIENRMKFGNVNAELVKALEKADAFGYADKYKRGLMTEEEVKKFLKIGERIKPTEKELTWTKDRSPKIFGYSYDEIARKQGIPYLR